MRALNSMVAATLLLTLSALSGLATAKFLSADPVKTNPNTGANFNRYTYGNNNPYLFTDPDGRNAIVKQMKDGSVDISIPVNFTGPGATAANINAAKADIAAKWSGTQTVGGKQTTVNVQVVAVDKNTPAKAINNIVMTTGPTSNTKSQGSSFVRGGNTGEWNTTSPGMASGEAAHEGGHLMGAKDHYTSGVDAAGNRTTTASPGWGGNLMGDNLSPTTTVNAANFTEIMASKGNVYEKEK